MPAGAGARPANGNRRRIRSWMQEGKGGTDMADKGKRDKGKREQQQKAKLTIKEKRKLKRDRKAGR